MPEAVQRRYYTQPSRWTGDPAYFSTPTADKPAFQDRGNRLVTDNDSREVAKDLVTVAEHRGWDRVQVAGSETFRRAVWFEAAERGIAVRGYKPTDRDLQELDRIRNDKARNSIAPVSERQQAREAPVEPTQDTDTAPSREAQPRDRARPQDIPPSSPTRSSRRRLTAIGGQRPKRSIGRLA
ncbi:LPD7 domain-containing protein [Novosphingobium panipatense]